MKTFKDVFPTLSFESSTLEELSKYIEVSRLSASKDFDKLTIYIKTDRLIDKMSLIDLEKNIKNSLFANRKILIKIVEKFNLASIYNPQNLYEAYKESIGFELKNYNRRYYLLFNSIKFTFEGTKVSMEIEDTGFNRSGMPELIRILEKIFIERCGISCNFIERYVEYKKDEELTKIINNSYYENIRNTAINKDDSKFMTLDTSKKAIVDIEVKSEKKEIHKETKTETKEVKKFEKNKFVYSKKSTNPDVLYGKDFDDNFIKIEEILGEIGEVNVKGQICSLDERFFERTGSTLFALTITDFTDSINVKIFAKEHNIEDIRNALKVGSFIKLRGLTTIDRFDNELVISNISGIKKCEDMKTNLRVDTANEKRVELHCHTKMSEFDGVSSEADIIKQAYKWGWDAIAITDHGNVQAFTDANHVVEKFDRPFKLLYGVEGYVVDDLKELVINPREYTLDDTFVVFDIETTGFSATKDKIIEFGAVKIKNGEIIDRFSSFVNPQIPIPFKIEELTSINDSMVAGADTIDVVLPKFLEFSKDCIAVAHNASFDTGFVKEKSKDLGLEYKPSIIDTVAMARLLLPNLNRFKLDTVSKALGIKLENHHRAVDDAAATAYIWIEFIKMLKDRDLYTLKEVSALGESSINIIKKSRANHIIIIAKNDIGRINLYKLVSLSHIEYFNKMPRIPKSILRKYREGLIIGSACEAGELYEAILDEKSDEEIEKLVKFYDYLEIQPIDNNRFMINSERYRIESEEDLKNINRRIVDLGLKYDKPVCATCDVHFLNPDDEIYRRIIMYGKGYNDADKQPPLFLRTTEEMLEEFSYLGENKAYEVVVTNTRKIADMVEFIKPVRPDKCPPVIENSDEELTKSCYEKAHKQYGEVLPEIVEARLKKELNSIISNGFAVMYIIAKKLVEKSMEDGYLVGSRGSVGSSFAAYTSGITEVNPLPPHYYCDCKYVEFDTPEVRAFSGMAGCDMPDKICPKCGKKLKKDGFDIPFETFLGFKGDKEPDIDLNFSGEYQAKAHAYTEVIFGEGHTFRAGTVGTLADKTAYGYVKKYYEEHGQRKRRCEIERITTGCVGVKRTTGQHPGGIIVLPHGEEIYSFTPVQRPANDMTTDIITTHFDYHAIDHNLLKLDILGHMDPTMIRMLSDLTGIDPVKDIPLDCKKTMSLFQSTEALGLKPEDLMGCPLGALGVPEFGTDFAMQMLIDAKPEGLSDLVRISGLSHGTDVWLGNAQTLIQDGKATIRTAICTRDDIMIYLIDKGLEEGKAFKIMESVRKGKGLSDENIADMKEKGVPDWYIWSCQKIKYMFPKAHAAAYVMMAWRIAYCKINYPLEYYTAFFTIRASAFSYASMCDGKQRLESRYKELLRLKNEGNTTAKDADTLRDMRIVQEMYARGFEFAPIDIYTAKADKFIITADKRIMPSLASIDGLGEIAAASIEQAAKQGRFMSKEDFMSRAKVGKSTCELLDSLNLLSNLPKSNQISIFDILV